MNLEGLGQDYSQPEVQLPTLQHIWKKKKVIEPIVKIGEVGAETLEIAIVKLTIHVYVASLMCLTRLNHLTLV